MIKMSFSLKPVVGKEFVGRKEILQRLFSELENEKSINGFALYGKRRVGKTSILLETKRRLEEKQKIVPIYISVWDLVEWRLDELCAKIISETVNAYKPRLGLPFKFEEIMRMSYAGVSEFLKKLEVKAEVADLITLGVSLSKERPHDLNKNVEDAFLFPEKMAQRTDTKVVLMIDEFPSIVELTNGKKLGIGIMGKLRTIHEKYKKTTLCVSGSIMKTMENAVLSPSAAFYGQLTPINVPPLSLEETTELLKANLGAKITLKSITKLFELTNGFSLYVNAIGIKLSNKKKIGEEEITTAFDEFLSEEGSLIFKRDFYICSSKERSILIQMCQGKTSITQIANGMDSSPATVGKLMSYLEEKGVVEKSEEKYTLVDPVFEKWIRKTFNDIFQ